MISGCGGGSSSKATPTAPAKTAVVAEPTIDATSTAAARRAASSLEPAMLQASDVPGDLKLQPPQVQLVHPGEIPGLGSTASGEAKTAASADGNEFVMVIAVLPDDGNADAMLQKFTQDTYLRNVTGGAEDAQGTPLMLDNAPEGAKAFSYSGTPTTSTGSHHVEGEVVGFVQSGVFVVVNHGRYAASDRTIDVGQIATNIAKRLASPGLD